jgi:hypothetical protein
MAGAAMSEPVGTSDSQSSVGAVTVRGPGTRRETARITQAVNDGLSAAAEKLIAGQAGPIDIGELKVRLPAHAGPEAIAAALERAIEKAIEDQRS